MILNQTIQLFSVIRDWIDTNGDLLTVAATIAIAFFTFTLWRATSKMMKVAQEQSENMKTSIFIAEKTADAALKAAEVAEKSLALTDRPWLKISLEIAGPLQFIKFGEKTLIRTSVQIEIKNIGHSVATDIRHDCQIYIPPVMKSGYRFDEVSFQKDLFNKLTTQRMHPLDEGECIFPDDETVFTKNLDYFIKENDFINIEGFEEIEGRKFPPGYLYPILVICCVDYQFDTSPNHHQAGVIDRIVQTTPFPEEASGPTINNARAIKVGDEIPVNELKITRYGGAGRKAN
jgi:hypothetical protein